MVNQIINLLIIFLKKENLNCQELYRLNFCFCHLLNAETTSQMKTMEALLSLSTEFWSGLIDESEVTAPTPTTETVNKRQSVGSRVVGGSLQSQVLNPWTDRRQKKRALF